MVILICPDAINGFRHLLYSLKKLGLEYIDLYEPARLDDAVPVKELIGVLSELVQAGYV